MAYLTKDQVKQIIQNAPQGTTPEGIVAGLRQKGHKLEGYDMGTKEQPALEKPTEKRTFVEKVGSFLGIEPLGRGLGLAAFKYLTPEGRELERKVSQGKASQEELMAYSDIFSKTPTTKEIIGSAIQTAATIGAPGIRTGKILPTIAKVGSIGAVAGFGAGLEKEKTIMESAKQAFIAGLTSATTYGTIAGTGKITKKILEKTPERLYNDVLKVNQKLLIKGKSPSSVLIEEGNIGTLGSLAKQTRIKMSELNNSISNKLVKTKKTISSSEIIKSAFVKLKEKFGATYTETEIKTTLKKLPIADLIKKSELTLPEANKLRQQLDKLLGERFFLTTTQPPLTKSATGIITNLLRDKIQTSSGTQTEFFKLSAYIRANQLINRTIAQADKNFNLGLKDLMVGGAFGLGGGVPTGITAIVVKKGIESPLAKTFTAVQLNKLNQFIEKIPTDSTGKISKTLLINIFKKIGIE